MLILFKALIVFVFSKIHYPRKKHKIAISAPKSSNFLTLSYIIIFGHQQENYYHGVKKKYHDMIIYYHAVIKDFPGLRVLFEYKLSELVEAAAPCVPFVGSALRLEVNVVHACLLKEQVEVTDSRVHLAGLLGTGTDIEELDFVVE